MKRKIHWKTVIMLLLFSVSVLLLSVVVLSSLCLNYIGTIFLYMLLLVACYTGEYLHDRYKNI